MGHENNEKIQDQGIYIKKDEKVTWAENFWYHYKWAIIGIAVAAVILFVCIVQSCTKREEDILIVYAGPAYLSQTELASVVEVMGNTMPRDFDENGDKFVIVDMFQIFSEEQIKDITAQTDANGKQGYVDRSRNSSNYDQYNKYVLTGDSSIYLLDPFLYETLKTNDRLCKLTDVLSDEPKGAIDEYGVRLGDTDLYKEYGVLRVLPEDTVICIARPFVAGTKTSKEKYYNREKEMFSAIVDTPLKTED
ncbi:MAG: hypothetical protein E7670_03000 [Ruminococcaceae bacterium]|nr:hypothetical protein [Oscillospiraceae bacterium]